MNQYQVTIGNTYWNYNYFNVGVTASHQLAEHLAPLTIILSNGQIIETTINRTANSNGSVRFNGKNAWHQFIRNNYELFDVISFQVNNSNTITIFPNE